MKEQTYRTNGHAPLPGGVVASATPIPERYWDDPNFLDALMHLLVYNKEEALERCADLLTPEDFKHYKGGPPNGWERSLVADLALEFWEKHNAPIGDLLLTEVLAFFKNYLKHQGSSKVNQHREYVEHIKNIQVATPDAILDKVIAYKGHIFRENAIDELSELQGSGQLTPEKWNEVTNAVAEKLRAAATPVQGEPLPVQWPEKLSPAALHGLAGDVVRAIGPVSEADPAALLFQLLVGFGNLIGRGPHFRVGSTHHYSNLFAVIVGPTGSAGKGMAWSQVESILAGVDAKWAADRVIGGLSSGEGLITLVKDKEVKSTPIREKGIIKGYQEKDKIVDQGVEDKRLMVVEQEFANVLLMCFDRKGNSLQQVIRNLWDTGDLNVATKERKRATGAHGSMIGHITQEELLKMMNSTAMSNGFVNRFIWICAKRSKPLPRGGALKDSVRSELIRRVSEAVDFARDVELMHRSKEAGKLWDTEYPGLSEERAGLLGKATGRGAPIVMRMACLYALMDGSSRINAIHLRAALAAWNYCFRSAQFIFGDAVRDPLANETLTALRTARETGMTRRDINDHFQHHRSSQEITRVLLLLQKQGRVQVRKEEGKGRPAERWLVV